MRLLLGVALIGAAAWYLATLSGCRHLDEDGRSFLAWSYHRGRLRGWCQSCGRWTSGWDVPPPQGPRFPSARKATAAEIFELERARAARSWVHGRRPA